MLGARNRRVIYAGLSLPTFHAMGMIVQLMYPLLSGCPVVLFAPQWPAPPVVPHLQNTLRIARLCGCTAMSVVPSFLEVRGSLSEAHPIA